MKCDMATKEEIAKLATENFMKKQAKNDDSALSDTIPEFEEIKESGFCDMAKEKLMSNTAKDFKQQWKEYRESFGEKVLSDNVSIQRDYPLNQLITDMKSHL